VIVTEALCKEFRVALPWELLHADDLVVIAETEDDLIKRLTECKDNVENKGMRVNMNKTKVMISGQRQKVTQKAITWPCGVCGKGIQYSVLVIRTEQNIFICLNRVTQFTTHRKYNRQAARKALWLNNAGSPNSRSGYTGNVG